MPAITNFSTLGSDGKPIQADPFGNNVAFRCKVCSHPVLAIAMENQRGYSERNPAECRSCGTRYCIQVDEDAEEIHVHLLTPFELCPVCGGKMEHKQVEKLLRGGNNTLAVRVAADVCLRCGERLYTKGAVEAFERMRAKLQNHEFSHFKELGRFFTVAEDYPDKAIHPAD